MVSSLLHALPPIAPAKLPSTKNSTSTVSTAVIPTHFSSDDNSMINEKHSLPTAMNRCQQHSLTMSSFRDADPFVHSRQDVRNVASAFNASLNVAQSLRDFISFLLFKPMIVPMKENVQEPEQVMVHDDNQRSCKAQPQPQHHHHHHQQQQQQQKRKLRNSSRRKLSSSKSTSSGDWPSCVAPAIPPRKKVDNKSSNNSSSSNNNSDRGSDIKDHRASVHSKTFQVPSAAQQMRPRWAMTHKHMRDTRLNANELRMLATEANMIRNAKITRPLRNRRYLDKRQDEFVWGRRSCLRIYDNGAGDHNKQLHIL